MHWTAASPLSNNALAHQRKNLLTENKAVVPLCTLVHPYRASHNLDPAQQSVTNSPGAGMHGPRMTDFLGVQDFAALKVTILCRDRDRERLTLASPATTVESR